MKIVPDFTYASPNDPAVKRGIIRGIERLAGKKKILRLYKSIPQEMAGHPGFFFEAIKVLKVDLDWDKEQLAKIPKDGPVIFIANHPFGVLDGIIMCNLAATNREKWGIMINEALCKVDHLKENLLPINFDETKEAVKLNIESKKKAMKMLKAGGSLIIFPAGGISTADRKGFGEVTDLEWKLFTAKLIQMTRATVVPVFFHGRNSRIFQIVSQFSLTLRLSMVIRELRRQIGKTQKVTIGDPIFYDQMEVIKGRQALLDYLREKTYALETRH
ncbi:MAG: lysophospholipid acyltransferase family protein [Chloroflexota bacterium]